jgi:uncharacterized membrane protein YfcA
MESIAAFLIGFLAGFIGSISAGGGLISIPGLIFLGANPITAIATTRLNLIAGGTVALYKYAKGGVVLWKYIPQFFVIALVAGIIGPKLLLGIDEEVVQRLVGATLLLTVPILWFKKDAGTLNIKRSNRRRWVGFPVMAIILLYAVMFGSGAGIFMIYAFIYFFGTTVIEARATSAAIVLLATIVAVISYLSFGVIDWGLGLPLITGGMIGSYFGAHTALTKGNRWVKFVLTVVVLMSGIKLLIWA